MSTKLSAGSYPERASFANCASRWSRSTSAWLAPKVELSDLRELLRNLESRTASLQQEADVLAEQASDLRSRLNQRRQHREGLQQEVALGRKEISTIAGEFTQLEAAWQNVANRGGEGGAARAAIAGQAGPCRSGDSRTRANANGTGAAGQRNAGGVGKSGRALAAVQARLFRRKWISSSAGRNEARATSFWSRCATGLLKARR